ncbi:hypothetical protein AB838_18300 [Rhodobacteraceae bacterium (ex Bugula neritina AB1)]|nr:hypothetical protein AB838_18300 [Rhodobacteraceae bacterium (ex Bugula neritina AB1)]
MGPAARFARCRAQGRTEDAPAQPVGLRARESLERIWPTGGEYAATALGGGCACAAKVLCGERKDFRSGAAGQKTLGRCGMNGS